MIRTKRIYESSAAEDGFRILVDRLWPRGVKKERAEIALWLKEIAPSNDLRKWFAHDRKKWAEFMKKYAKELVTKQGLLNDIRQIERENGVVTLLYSAKDKERNNAVALKIILEKMARPRGNSHLARDNAGLRRFEKVNTFKLE